MSLSNSSISSAQTISNISSLFDYKVIYVIFFLYTTCMMLMGLFGNLLIIFSVMRSKRLRNDSTCIMCSNIALADLLFSIFVNGLVKMGNYLKVLA